MPIGQQQAKALIDVLSSFSRTLQGTARDRKRSLSTSRIVTLRHLHGADRRISELAHALDVDTSVMTRIVQSLEADGQVRRTTDPADRRASLIGITDAGRASVADRERWLIAKSRELLPDWSDDEAAAAVKVLQRMESTIREFRAPDDESTPKAPDREPTEKY